MDSRGRAPEAAFVAPAPPAPSSRIPSRIPRARATLAHPRACRVSHIHPWPGWERGPGGPGCADTHEGSAIRRDDRPSRSATRGPGARAGRAPRRCASTRLAGGRSGARRSSRSRGGGAAASGPGGPAQVGGCHPLHGYLRGTRGPGSSRAGPAASSSSTFRRPGARSGASFGEPGHGADSCRRPRRGASTRRVAGCQPRSAAIFTASLTFRSSVPSVSWTSTTSVLSSMTSRVRVAACQHRMSMTPRSPKMENVTSGVSAHPGIAWNSRATASCIAEWRAASSRSSSAPSHRASTVMRIPSASATRRRVPCGTPPIRPRSIREIVCCETPATRARSAWRQHLRIRTARKAPPSLESSIGRSWTVPLTRGFAATYPGLRRRSGGALPPLTRACRCRSRAWAPKPRRSTDAAWRERTSAMMKR